MVFFYLYKVFRLKWRPFEAGIVSGDGDFKITPPHLALSYLLNSRRVSSKPMVSQSSWTWV